MILTTTRLKQGDEAQCCKFSDALLSPSSVYGGLFAPKDLPKISSKFFKKERSYEEFALKVIEKFSFDLDINSFKKAIKRYRNFDDENSPIKIKKISKNLYINELFHGPTRAFKDMALQPFGKILDELAKDRFEKYLIMCATSGDTGPATLNTFEKSKNVKVVCLYPIDGTSEVQRLQMVTSKGKNLKVIGIKGNFDDAQRALKTLLNDEDFKEQLLKENLNLSAANSVNFGRILFQILYHLYVYAYLLFSKKIKDDESIDIIVPSGNFGNALGAYYAKKMGAKIGMIKIASNSNNILTEFFNTGVYDLRNKKLIKTMSPAMDILISSNVERLLFDKFGSVRTKELMDSLNKNKFYELSKDELKELQNDFMADFCTDEECAKFIKECAKDSNLIDPHTATCFKMVQKDKIGVITSTAQWVKFTPSMIKAIKNENIIDEKKQMIKLAKEFDAKIPKSILTLFDDKINHSDVVDQSEIKNTIIKWIKS
ncbi:MAG: threonine synthase [Campylobacter sputorum]|uniref:threonine synthase n=1 Tax=Campylobacter sputorum TaxID=206 RepID=UPI000B77E19D|nr:threonine synthase [Campylobacter sputorum]ASM38393.1 threonine synthase [Campylobacter sputorum bv. paraureolyticus LMG 11764]MDY6119816.1 threonine synthase [Campylobacter sputorum]